MDYAKIFNRFRKANATRQIDWATATADEKFRALEAAGKTLDPKKEYTVTDTVEFDGDKTAYMKRALAAGADFETAAKFQPYKYTVKKLGEKLTQKQALAVLSAGVKFEDGKITVDVFGGSNFVGFCNWLRGLTGEEFEKLVNAE